MKEKILITGMNTLQVTRDQYLNQQLQVVPSHYSLIRCLEDMGYEVEQRYVEIGESLEEYADVIVFIHNPSGFAGFVYNALWAVHVRPDCILAFDDWQTDSIYKGLLALEDPAKLFRDYVKDGHKNIPNDVEKYSDILIAAIDKIESKTNRMLISAFAGGDLQKVLEYPTDLIFGYNPNPYHLHRKVKKGIIAFEDVAKQRVFNFAGLVQDKTAKWLKKQNVESTGWELKLYGSRKDGQDRVKEPEMVNIFGAHWAALMAGYHHSGSGWWRARILQVADAGSILIGEPEEMILYYQDSVLANLKATDIAEMTDGELELIALSQKEALYDTHPLDKSVQQSELAACLAKKS